MPTKNPSLSRQITGTTSPTFAGARDATSGTVVTGGIVTGKHYHQNIYFHQL